MTSPTDPIRYLRRLRDAGNHNDVVQMIRDRESAIRQWGSVFSNPSRLTSDQLADFLLFEHNRHWWGLQRRTDRLVGSFEAVRAMIGELLDTDVPLSERIDQLGEPREFDHDVWSPILLVTHPDEYGVWNTISESAMRRLGLWPEVADGATVGETYVRVNEMLGLVRADVDTDLWTLDALWWAAEKEHDPTRHFVARTKPAPVRRERLPAVTRTRTLQTAKAKVAAVAETFACESCWTTKPLRLASETAGICVDCA
ncbi:MAG: hypothetical protein WD532_11450 [Acidimicrobiia bacterium]